MTADLTRLRGLLSGYVVATVLVSVALAAAGLWWATLLALAQLAVSLLAVAEALSAPQPTRPVASPVPAASIPHEATRLQPGAVRGRWSESEKHYLRALGIVALARAELARSEATR